MRRRLLNLLTLLSLLLCVAVAALWVRSYWRIDGLCGEAISHYYEMYTWRGGLWLGDFGADGSRAEVPRAVRRLDGEAQLQLLFEDMRHGLIGWFGFGSSSAVAGAGTRLRLFVVPLWLPGIVLAYLPVLHLLGWRRRTGRSGLCPRCGYDLRATPDRCPECGTFPLPDQSAKSA